MAEPRWKASSRRWGLAIVVNVAAALAAALAFGAWQRAQAPARAAVVSQAGDFELVDDVGYLPKANSQLRGGPIVNRQRIYDVSYTIGPDHFRVVPKANDTADACVLLFGDSFTFGEGVKDDETFAAQIVALSGGRVAARNLAMTGWGPHQFLAGLQSGRFQQAVHCKPTDAFFLMIPELVWRVSGFTNPWDTNGPRYQLDAGGRPVRVGTLGDPDPYNWRRWIGLRPVSKGTAKHLAIALIAEAMAELKRLYPDIRTHLILYRVASWTDVDFTVDELVQLEYELQQARLTPIPLEAIIPNYRFATQDYVLHPTDTHPNARAHRRIAQFILREIQDER
jgi:hypothetical protein